MKEKSKPLDSKEITMQEKIIKQVEAIANNLIEEFEKTPQYISDDGFFGNTQSIRIELEEEISDTLSNYSYQNFFCNYMHKYSGLTKVEILSCSISGTLIVFRIRTEWI